MSTSKFTMSGEAVNGWDNWKRRVTRPIVMHINNLKVGRNSQTYRDDTGWPPKTGTMITGDLEIQ